VFILALKSRQRFPNQIFTVWGGRIIPGVVIAFGILVIVCWFGSMLSILPRFG